MINLNKFMRAVKKADEVRVPISAKSDIGYWHSGVKIDKEELIETLEKLKETRDYFYFYAEFDKFVKPKRILWLYDYKEEKMK